MKARLLTFALICFVIYSVASAATLYSLYYKVIGNGNFYVQSASIEPNGTVRLGGDLFHVYASYSGTPYAYDYKNGVLYFIYPSQNGGSTYYQIGRGQGIQQTNFNNVTLDLQYDGAQDKLYAVQSSPSEEQYVSLHARNEKYDQVARSDPVFVELNPNNLSSITIINPSIAPFASGFTHGALDVNRRLYHYASTYGLTTLDLSTSTSSQVALNNCSYLTSLFYARLANDGLIAVSTSRSYGFGDVIVNILNSSTGKCSYAVSFYGNVYYGSTYDEQSDQLAVITDAGLYIVNVRSLKYELYKDVNRYTPEYFVALHYA